MAGITEPTGVRRVVGAARVAPSAAVAAASTGVRAALLRLVLRLLLQPLLLRLLLLLLHTLSWSHWAILVLGQLLLRLLLLLILVAHVWASLLVQFWRSLAPRTSLHAVAARRRVVMQLLLRLLLLLLFRLHLLLALGSVPAVRQRTAVVRVGLQRNDRLRVRVQRGVHSVGVTDRRHRRHRSRNSSRAILRIDSMLRLRVVLFQFREPQFDVRVVRIVHGRLLVNVEVAVGRPGVERHSCLEGPVPIV